MPSPLEHVNCARLPVTSLAFLAEVRCRPNVTVAREGNRVWLRWPAGQEDVLRQVIAVPGVELFEQRDGTTYSIGHHLPTFVDPEAGQAVPLHQTLYPARLANTRAATLEASPIRVHLAAEENPRPTTALRCHVGALAKWAELAPTAELTPLQGVRWKFEVLVRGKKLPALDGSERFWGDRLLVPLGRRPDPPLPESAICSALGVTDDEIAILFDDGIDVIPKKLFRHLTRAGVRIGLMGFK